MASVVPLVVLPVVLPPVLAPLLPVVLPVVVLAGVALEPLVAEPEVVDVELLAER